MIGRPNVTASRGASKNRRVKSGASYETNRPSKIDRLVEIIDQCTIAKEVADEIGDHFLSYLLAMTIQEARSAMRPALPKIGDEGSGT